MGEVEEEEEREWEKKRRRRRLGGDRASSLYVLRIMTYSHA